MIMLTFLVQVIRQASVMIGLGRTKEERQQATEKVTSQILLAEPRATEGGVELYLFSKPKVDRIFYGRGSLSSLNFRATRSNASSGTHSVSRYPHYGGFILCLGWV
jgi:hypothetical protein